MRAHPRTRALLSLAAGATVTALFCGTLAVSAQAAPKSPAADPAGKIKLASGSYASRVMKGHYLVETTGRPLVRGGNKTVDKAAVTAAKTAATDAGATVKSSYSTLWTGISVTATDEQVKELAKSSAVSAIYPVLTVALPKNESSKADAAAALSEVGAAGTDYTGKGIKVGIIDTGIDYDNADLGGSGVAGGDTFPTTRVAYGYDFVGDAYDSSGETGSTTATPDGNPMDCEGHGTHVAGIVGANGSSSDSTSVTGVAPEVTLGAYRIFGCDGSTSTDVIIAAMTKAQSDGMDVVNMSLGSDFDSWPDYPDAVAATSLADSGVVVVAAAGNSGDTGLFSAGSPGVGAGVISVASYESTTVRTDAVGIGSDKLPYTATDGAAAAPTSGSVKITNASNGTACTKPKAVAAGTALLVKYGSCYVYKQVENAVAAGASAVVIYYSHADLASFSMGTHTTTVPSIGISGTQGSALAAKIKKSGAQTMSWLGLQAGVTNPTGGKISSFSSAGLAADLSLVPTIAAPGGNIYSTLPISQGRHGNMSGTSMASPYVAGSVALLLEAKPALKGHPGEVSRLLYDTAVPVKKATESGVTKYPEAVFRQGAGLVNAANAIAAADGVSASASVDGKQAAAVINLGEGTKHTVTVTLTNSTTSDLSYSVQRLSGVSAAASTGSATYVGTTTPSYGYGDVGFAASSKTVTVPAGGTATVTVTITAPSKVLKGKTGMLYGGWLQFTTTSQVNAVSVPLVGLRGDYQSVKVLNGYKLVDTKNKKWSLPRLGEYDPDEGSYYFYSSTKSGQYWYDMNGWYPGLWVHLDYPASDVRLKVINTKTKKSYYALIDTTITDPDEATHLGKISRDDDPWFLTFYGYYLDGSEAKYVSNGTYQLQLKVLKPLGDASNSKHWETYTSPTFNIYEG